MPQVLRVEPLITARAVRGPFDYAMPADPPREIEVGTLLEVPFGRQHAKAIVDWQVTWLQVLSAL